MPTQLTLRSFLSFGFVNVNWFVETITQTIKAALGIYPTGHLGWKPQWEAICYPSSLPAARAPAMRWAQLLLIGHISVAVAAAQLGWSPLIPAMISVGPFLNGWLFWLCNSTQHVGLEYGTAANGKMISDFRRTTRSFTLHPFLAFWYWHSKCGSFNVGVLSLSLSLSLYALSLRSHSDSPLASRSELAHGAPYVRCGAVL